MSTTEVKDLSAMCDAILGNNDWKTRIPKCECCGTTCGNYTRNFGNHEGLTLCAACWARLASIIFDDWKQHRPPWTDDTELYIEVLKKSFQEAKEAEEETDQ